MSLLPVRFWSEDAPEPPEPPATTYTPWLPFEITPDMHAALDASTKIVGPHIMATQRRKVVEDKNIETTPTAYEWKLMPPGQVEAGTNHAPYGGLWRNRALGRNPLGTSAAGYGWELQDKLWEWDQIKAAGMRHAFIDILNAGTFNHVIDYGRSAMLKGCHAIAMPDANTSIVRNGAANLVSYLKQLFGGPYKTGWQKHTDGRWLVVPFGTERAVGTPPTATESALITYWKTVMQQMDAAGMPCALWTCHTADWVNTGQLTAYTFTKPDLAPWVVGLGRWGVSDAQGTINTSTTDAARSHNEFGKPYLYSPNVEDSRPNQDKFYEARGWDQIVSGMKVSLSSLVDMVQIRTGNDYAEGAPILPTVYHGWSDLDVIAYYALQKKLGYAPPIERDGLYLAHRRHKAPGSSPQPTYSAGSAYTRRMVVSGSTAAVNIIDVLAFATEDADIEFLADGVVVDTKSVSAGVSRVNTALVEGTISARMKRAGNVVAGTVVSTGIPPIPFLDPRVVTRVDFDSQVVQDMSYIRASSLRQATA